MNHDHCHHNHCCDCPHHDGRIVGGASSTIVNGCGNVLVDKKALERIAKALEDIASALRKK